MQKKKYNEPVFEGFESPTIRRGFIRKVLLILGVQLWFTFGLVTIFVFYEPLKEYAYKNVLPMYLCMGIGLVLVIAMACCESLRRTVPLNFYMLGIFTLTEAVIIGYIAARSKPETVLMALGMTAAVVIVLTIFATQTTIDFTMCGTGLLIAGLLLLVLGIVTIFFPSKTMHLVYCSIGVLLFSLYLVYDIQLMIGGNHAYSLDPEEYIFGALNLYLDIVVLFMYILRIIESSD